MKKKFLGLVLSLVTAITIFAFVPTTTVNAAMLNEISSDKALQIALDNAGYTEDEVGYSKVNDEVEDGVNLYEVKLVVGHLEYNYKIDMTSGQIIQCDIDQ